MKTWQDYLAIEKQKPYFKKLIEFLNERLKNTVVYPPKDAWFNAIKKTPYENVKGVILGQDPYHQPNQAMGLSCHFRTRSLPST